VAASDVIWSLNADVVLRDPLSDETRSSRKGLVVTSFVANIYFRLGVQIESAHLVGIKIATPNSPVIDLMLAVLVCYFLLSFAVHALIDIAMARMAIDEAVHAANEQQAQIADDTERARNNARRALAVHLRQRRRVTFVIVASSSIFLDFAAPIGLGILAVASWWTA